MCVCVCVCVCVFLCGVIMGRLCDNNDFCTSRRYHS